MENTQQHFSLGYVLGGLGLLIGFILILYLYDSSHFQFAQQKPTRIYFADNISKAHEKLINQFNQIHKGSIEVVPINLPFTKFSTNERKEILARSLRSKSNRIDIFAVDVIWVPRFAKWAEPLEKYFPTTERSKLLPQALVSCYHSKKLVGIPFYLDIALMYYRKDLLRRFPNSSEVEKRVKQGITWEELIQLQQEFPSKGHPFYLFPAKNYEGLVCSFIDILASQNGSIFQGDSVQLYSPEAIRTLQLLVDLIQRYRITSPVITAFDETDVYHYALETDAIFFRGWPAITRQYQSTFEPFLLQKLSHVGLAPLPHFNGGKPTAVFGGWNLMLSRFSAHKKEALEFMRYVLSEDSQELMYIEGEYLPVLKNVYNNNDFNQRFPLLKIFRKMFRYGVHRPYVYNYTKISDVIAYYTHKAIRGEISVPEALQEATRVINSKEVLIR